MTDYENEPLYHEYIKALNFFKEKGYRVECHKTGDGSMS